MNALRELFDSLATNGKIGNANGQMAYAYLRVSTDEQAEEGRSGLPRQLQHCHEIAQQQSLSISWSMIYFDDYTGFEFEGRPALTELRNRYKSGNHRSQYIVIEDLDRLSRNADWHQGYLLDEMAHYGLQVVFWKPIGSRVERAVRGAIAHDGWEQTQARMREGKMMKAKSGRVTASTRKYGYQFVNAHGEASQKPGKDTHYAIFAQESDIIVRIYTCLAKLRMTARKVAVTLNADHIPPPGQYTEWRSSFISELVRNPIYKGEFIANRYRTEKKSYFDEFGREQQVNRNILRPPEDWTIVPVPAIVTPEIWQDANDVLSSNKALAKRNTKGQYLLRGILRCAHCQLSFFCRNDSPRDSLLYACNSKYRVEHYPDHKRYIKSETLDQAVWDAICYLLLHPELLNKALDHFYNDTERTEAKQRQETLQIEISDLQRQDERIKKAYLAGAYDAQEFAHERQQIVRVLHSKQQELHNLQQEDISPEAIEARKQSWLQDVERAKQLGLLKTIDFDTKQRILRTVVDQITVNLDDQIFDLEGPIGGRFVTGSSQRLGHKFVVRFSYSTREIVSVMIL